MPFDWGRWLPIILGTASGITGAAQANAQRDFAERAAQGQPFSQERQPYAPTIPLLGQVLQDAMGIYEHQRGFRPPPQRGIGGGVNRQALSELAAEARRRALGSQFIPQAQQAALGLMQGPNPFLAQAFAAAQGFRSPPAALPTNPILQQLLRNLLPGLNLGGVPAAAPAPSPISAPAPSRALRTKE